MFNQRFKFERFAPDDDSGWEVRVPSFLKHIFVQGNGLCFMLFRHVEAFLAHFNLRQSALILSLGHELWGRNFPILSSHAARRKIVSCAVTRNHRSITSGQSWTLFSHVTFRRENVQGTSFRVCAKSRLWPFGYLGNGKVGGWSLRKKEPKC